MIDFKRTIFVGILGGFIGLLLYFYSRAQGQPVQREKTTGDIILRFPGVLPWSLAIMVGLAFIGLIILGFTVPFKNAREFYVTIVGGTAFFLPAPIFIVYLFKAEFCATSEGIEYRGLLSRTRSLRWADVSRVKVSHDGTLKITSTDKTKIKVPTMIRGRVELLDIMEEHLPPDVASEHKEPLEKYREHLNKPNPLFPS